METLQRSSSQINTPFGAGEAEFSIIQDQQSPKKVVDVVHKISLKNGLEGYR